MKKSYNPFKLFGTYIGLVLGIFFSWFYQMTARALDCHEIGLSLAWERCSFLGALVKTPAFSIIELLNLSGMGELLVLIILPIVGLILGYGIHALIRGIRK